MLSGVVNCIITALEAKTYKVLCFFFFRENVSIAPHPYFPWTLIFRNWIMFDLANASHG